MMDALHRYAEWTAWWRTSPDAIVIQIIIMAVVIGIITIVLGIKAVLDMRRRNKKRRPE